SGLSVLSGLFNKTQLFWLNTKSLNSLPRQNPALGIVRVQYRLSICFYLIMVCLLVSQVSSVPERSAALQSPDPCAAWVTPKSVGSYIND
ncbi:hypothetical protein, partial [Pedobacter sp. MR2016-19]|uniref:hypothetical protein n=1 Tax=Pedobacter sp. MR2016-19 TaxID=2780089 RepID=UPI001D0B967C